MGSAFAPTELPECWYTMRGGAATAQELWTALLTATSLWAAYRGFCCRRSYRVLVAERTAQARRLHEAAERERNRQVEMEAQAPGE